MPPRALWVYRQAVFLANAIRSRVAGRSIGKFSYIVRGTLASLGSESEVGILMRGTARGQARAENDAQGGLAIANNHPGSPSRAI